MMSLVIGINYYTVLWKLELPNYMLCSQKLPTLEKGAKNTAKTAAQPPLRDTKKRKTKNQTLPEEETRPTA